MSLSRLYLVLAILGTVVPYYFFLDFFVDEGIDIAAFVAALFANGAVAGFTADIFLSSLVFWVFMFSKKADGPKAWPFIVLNLTIGLSCALPAYLWAKEKLEETA